jgi:hypothetical protein
MAKCEEGPGELHRCEALPTRSVQKGANTITAVDTQKMFAGHRDGPPCFSRAANYVNETRSILWLDKGGARFYGTWRNNSREFDRFAPVILHYSVGNSRDSHDIYCVTTR